MTSGVPSYPEFSARAKEIARAVPAEFLAGVDDLVVHREVRRHPLLADVVTLGECETSPFPAMFGSEEVRSIVHVYYGSFVDLARRDDTFDVDAELRETIEHEIRHHIEDRAGRRDLEDEDDLFDARERFREGLSTPPGWYRRGEALAPDVYGVDLDVFVELRLRRAQWRSSAGTTLRLEVLGEPLDVAVPRDARPGTVVTFRGEGLAADDAERGEPHAPGPHDEGDVGDLHVVFLAR